MLSIFHKLYLCQISSSSSCSNTGRWSKEEPAKNYSQGARAPSKQRRTRGREANSEKGQKDRGEQTYPDCLGRKYQRITAAKHVQSLLCKSPLSLPVGTQVTIFFNVNPLQFSKDWDLCLTLPTTPLNNDIQEKSSKFLLQQILKLRNLLALFSLDC